MMERVRISVTVAYFVVVVIGASCIYVREDATKDPYLARQDLPAGHLIRLRDLEENPDLSWVDRATAVHQTELVGKYVGVEHKAHQPISPGTLTTTPVLRFSEDSVGYVASLQDQPWLADILDVGDRVALCAEMCLVSDVRVIALVCDSKCSAVLELCKEDVAKLKDKAVYRLFLKNLGPR